MRNPTAARRMLNAVGVTHLVYECGQPLNMTLCRRLLPGPVFTARADAVTTLCQACWDATLENKIVTDGSARKRKKRTRAERQGAGLPRNKTQRVRG